MGFSWHSVTPVNCNLELDRAPCSSHDWSSYASVCFLRQRSLKMGINQYNAIFCLNARQTARGMRLAPKSVVKRSLWHRITSRCSLHAYASTVCARDTWNTITVEADRPYRLQHNGRCASKGHDTMRINSEMNFLTTTVTQAPWEFGGRLFNGRICHTFTDNRGICTTANLFRCHTMLDSCVPKQLTMLGRCVHWSKLLETNMFWFQMWHAQKMHVHTIVSDRHSSFLFFSSFPFVAGQFIFKTLGKDILRMIPVSIPRSAVYIWIHKNITLKIKTKKDTCPQLL